VPERLDTAHRRSLRSDGFSSASLDRGVAETARRPSEIRDPHGPGAIAFHISGQMSIEVRYLATELAKGFIRTWHVEANSRFHMASAGSGYRLSLCADAPAGSGEDVERADLFLVVGSTMADCDPILFLRMMERVRASARPIVIDPRRTATAEKAGLFLQLQPGRDLALPYLLVESDDIDPGFIACHADGWDALPAFLADDPPARLAAITGLAEADIRRAAAWVDTAFSRDQPERIDVQHRLRKQGPELWRRLEEEAHLYVCGDAACRARTRMPLDGPSSGKRADCPSARPTPPSPNSSGQSGISAASTEATVFFVQPVRAHL
jgi:anaerobic selenocysteine-containing dehydrogenase